MKKQERTPGPWGVQFDEQNDNFIVDANGEFVTSSLEDADATAIVHCVNTYDELVGALEHVTALAYDLASDGNASESTIRKIEAARAVLKLAKGNGE